MVTNFFGWADDAPEFGGARATRQLGELLEGGIKLP